MRAGVAAFAVVFLAAAPLDAVAAGTPRLSTPLDVPKLSEPLSTARFFDTDSFLTTTGRRYFAAPEVAMEPEVGLGYQARDLELSGGMEQSTHRVHALAGWRVSLADTLHLSASAKLPMLTVDSVGLYAGDELGMRPGFDARQGYQLSNLSRSGVTWRGELGIHLAPQTDFTLYYDQSPVSGWYSGGSQQEERIGTRFILRFK